MRHKNIPEIVNAAPILGAALFKRVETSRSDERPPNNGNDSFLTFHLNILQPIYGDEG